MTTLLRQRQIHLDFHTGPDVPDVGVDFNAKRFAETLAAAHVNSITLFAKCHHGHLYYGTQRPERHSGLKAGLNLLEEQIEACRAVGIRTPIYLSVQCDEYAANLHPEWVARNPDGTPVGRPPLGTQGWQILDMCSPYADFLAEQVTEVVQRFKPVDGIFFDMCWDQPSVSRWAIDAMRRAGLDPASEADRATHARQVVHGYMDRYNRLIADVNGSAPAIWYNSRPKTRLADEAKYLQHVEIEALPTGGWGYTYFPLNVRWSRNFGLPFLGMTARFHKTWSDFGGYKPAAALKYELAQMLAHGGGCSVGDQLHPRGELDAEAYRLIGDAYQHVAACEPFGVDAQPVTEVAVLRSPDGGYHTKPGDALEGAVRLLQQLMVQFDFVSPMSDLTRFAVVIVPEGIDLSGATGEHLVSYVKGGGKLILAGRLPLTTASPELLRLAGVARVEESGARTPFFRYDRKLIPDAERSDVVLYDGTLRLAPTAAAASPAVIVEPYFQRSWDHFSGHGQTPPATVTDRVPATFTDQAAAIGFDLFGAYATHGQTHLRRLCRTLLNALLPRPLVRAELPSHVELTINQQPKRLVVHILSYAPQRRTPDLDLVEEATPLVNARVAIRMAEKPARVLLQPAGEPLAFDYRDGYVSFVFDSLAGHVLVTIE
ncbi:MAG: hypothetical protein JWM57_3164 [Phycisphaerales bacterium]|nr:hypothetical protein [Phycisphaerales bacterium]